MTRKGGRGDARGDGERVLLAAGGAASRRRAAPLAPVVRVLLRARVPHLVPGTPFNPSTTHAIPTAQTNQMLFFISFLFLTLARQRSHRLPLLYGFRFFGCVLLVARAYTRNSPACCVCLLPCQGSRVEASQHARSHEAALRFGFELRESLFGACASAKR